jgi:hypothetical protein
MVAGHADNPHGVWHFNQWLYFADLYSVTKGTKFYQLFCR